MGSNGNQDENKPDSIESITVSVTVLQKLLSVTDRRIRQLADEGIVIKATHGKYVLIPSVMNYIKQLKANQEINQYKTEEDLSYDLEHARNERIKRKQNELKYKVMKGQLHDARQIEFVWSEMLVNFRTKILGLPSKVAPLLVDRQEVGYIKTVLTEEMTEALNELKKYDPKSLQGDEYIDLDLIEDEPEDGEPDDDDS